MKVLNLWLRQNNANFLPAILLALAGASFGCTPSPAPTGGDPASVNMNEPTKVAAHEAAHATGMTETPSTTATAMGTAAATGTAMTDHGAGGNSRRAPREVREDGTRVYGGDLTDGDVTPLATILADTSQYDGQVVKTEGAIHRVCERMGCWIELQADSEGGTVHVKLAGHSYFLPMSEMGKTATIQGPLQIREIPAGERAHLESEGAVAAAQQLRIEAIGVLVRDS